MANQVHQKSANWQMWLEMAALAIMAIAFFVICHFGFLREDDLAMNHAVSSLSDLLEQTKVFYLTKGGRWLSVSSQYLFAGVLGENKCWFDIVSTLFFLLLVFVCGALIQPAKDNRVHVPLVFALVFWFLCPQPNETLFWIAGATTYLMAGALTFLFLLVYFRCKDDDYGIVRKIGLFFLSFIAASEFVSCASVCGAFTIYYAFHLKEFRKNAIPLVCGFILGSLVVLLAPGNFARAAWEGQSFSGKIQDLIHHPLLEIVKYKALWIFLIILAWGWIKDRLVVKKWMKENAVLLMSLGWSIIAFSVVFRPLNRALFFPETLSIILLLKFLYENYQVFELRFMNHLFAEERSVISTVGVTLLFVCFLVDATCAVAETKKQRDNNSALLEQLAESGGAVALDRMIPSHRMAYVERFPTWTWDPLASKFGLDSVRVYPYYCQDKYYSQRNPALANTYVEEIHVDDDSFGRMVRLIVRAKEEDLLKSNYHIAITVDYSRPRKWYKSWLDKLRNYQYERTSVVACNKPPLCFGGYGYYEVWMKRENTANLKRVTISYF